MLVLWGVTSAGLSFCWSLNTGLTRQMLAGGGVALRLAAPKGGHSVLGTGRGSPQASARSVSLLTFQMSRGWGCDPPIP